MNKNQLFDYIEERIYGNNNGAITGPILQDVLKKIVEFNSEQEGRIGKDGVGIDSITKTRGSDSQGTYTQLTIKTTDNRTTPFKVYDGSDGADGAQGPRGAAGRDGINGTDGADGRDGRDGDDGRDGKDGKDGKDGFQGRKGAAIRGPYDFYSMSSTTRWWCNGEESEDYPDSTLWIDIILKDDVYYYCNTTYYGRLAPWNNVRQNWTAGESYEFIATKILLARNAKINFLTNNELYLMDSNGHITGGAAGGNGVNFWAGAEHPSNGKFRVYADGRLVATDAQIKGAITATSLTLRGSDIENYIHNEVDDALDGFNPGDAIDENQVNDLIRQYLMTVDYVKPSDLNGYFNEERLRDWFRRNYSGWTEEQIEEIVRRIAQAETSSVDEIDLGDGRIKHIAYIGGRSYEWITVDTGDYIILGAVVSGRTGSGLTRFIVDKNGLLQANNAIIYGKVYASEGYFMGSVSATDGYFRGDITANSLTLGPGCELDIDPSELDIDLSDYYAAGMPWSSNTGLFKVGKDGLLQAKNAIISGNVYATNGVFKGDVYANNGSFKGTISAESGYIKDLHFGSATGKRLSVYIDDTIDEKIADALTGDLDPDVINQAINDYIANSGFTGYVTEDFFNNWINEWNAAHSATPMSESAVSAMVKSLVGSEISITSAVTNEWGGITHIANIGGREYRWDTYNTGDYLVLGNWFGDSATTGDGGFIVSTDGLLQANNAVIYGKVYASEGYFKGSVSATDGYFKGNITANTLTLGGSYGNKSLKQYVEGEVASAVEGEIDADMINSMISSYLDESGFTNFVTTDDYHAFSGFVAGWMAAHSASGITWASISGFAQSLINSELSKSLGVRQNADGSLTHTTVIGGREYTWDTFDTDDYMLLGNWVSATTGSSFMVDKKGLLQAENAVIYGKVYASEGYFKGSVSADSGYFKGSVSAENGYFKGSVEATSGKIGSVLITPQGLSATNIHITNNYMWSDNVALKGSISAENGYFTGELKAATGSFKGAISATSLYLGGQSYTEMPSGGDDPNALKKGVAVTGSDGTLFSVSTDGLLQANNAIINGTVYANDGYFKGSISADTGYFSNGIKVGGPNGPTFEQYIGNHISSSNIVTTYRGQYDSGKTYYGNSERCDIVRYGASYYITRPNAPDSDFSNIPPTDDEYWNFFDNSFENVATDYAFINNLVVSRLNTAGENGTSERIVAEGNELLMYDSANTMHLRIVGDEIDLSSPASSFRTSGKTENFYTHGNGQQDGHDEVWLNLVNIKLPQKAGTYTIQMPKFKLRSYHSPYYDSDFSDFYVKIYYKLSGTTNYIPVSERESWIAAGTEIGTYYFEADNITTTQITVGSQQANTQYEFWAQVEFDWWGENTQVPGDDSWSLALEVTDITNSSVFVIGSDASNIVTIGSNGLSVAIGTMTAIFGVQNGMAKIELRGNDSRGTDIGVRIDGVSGLTMSTGGTWVIPRLT